MSETGSHVFGDRNSTIRGTHCVFDVLFRYERLYIVILCVRCRVLFSFPVLVDKEDVLFVLRGLVAMLRSKRVGLP